MSQDPNIAALGEEVRKVKQKLRFLEFIFAILVVGFIIWGIATVPLGFAMMGAGSNGTRFMFANVAVAVLTFFGITAVLKYKRDKWIIQEFELKNDLLALLYPPSNCANCGKPLEEGNTFCSYCGNKRTP